MSPAALTLSVWQDRAALIDALHSYLAEIRIVIDDIPAMADRHLACDPPHVYQLNAPDPVGFAILRAMGPGTGAGMEIAEFRIFPSHRRQSLGTRAAHLLFARHPGVWQVAALPGAAAFWQHAITTSPGAHRITRAPVQSPHHASRTLFTQEPRP